MGTTKAKAANAATVVQEAAALAIQGFDGAKVSAAMLAMSQKRKIIDATTGELRDAALELTRLAENVATASAAIGMDGDSIAKGWSAEVRSRLPALAVDGCTFVKASEKKDGAFILTGYGQNVNSAARGVCQFPGEVIIDQCVNGDGEPSISAVIKKVRELREAAEGAEARALREAKAELAEAMKAYRESACEGNKAERIREFAAALIEAITAPEAEGEAVAEQVDKAA